MLAAFVLLAILVGLRIYVGIRAAQRCKAIMPPRNQLSWKLVSSQPLQMPEQKVETSDLARVDFEMPVVSAPNKQEKLFQWSPVMGAAFADGLLAGLPVAEAINHIDPSVLNAIESSTTEHLHSLPSIHSYVEQHFFSAPSISADGWFERLTGYVNEQHAASTLEAMGHHVTFAATANQPVWDLLVDGHPVQIKEGLAGVKQFLAEHHGIPIYTSHEVAAAAKDPLVHGLDILDPAHMHELTRASLEGISDSFQPTFHFPIITLAFSAYREAKLLMDENTTLKRALTHVSLDVVGVGAGAFGGAKAGAVAGAFVGGPVGAAIGGLFGAVAGGVGGKMFATGIRKAPFHEAMNAHELVISSYQAAKEQTLHSLRNDVRTLQTRFDSRYREARAEIVTQARVQVSNLSQAYALHFESFSRNFASYLRELARNLRADEEQVLAMLPPSGLMAAIYPREADHIRNAAKAWFREAYKTIRREIAAFASLRESDERNIAIRTFLSAYVFELESLQAELTRMNASFCRSQDAAKDIAKDAASRLQTQRDGLIHNFNEECSRLLKIVNTRMETWNTRIRESLEKVRREAAAVGIQI